MVCFINMMIAVSRNSALVLCLFTVYHKFILVWTQIQINFIIFCLRNNNIFMSWDSLMKWNYSNLIWWLEFPKWTFLFETALPTLSVLEIFLDDKAIMFIPMFGCSNQSWQNNIDICQFVTFKYLLLFLTYLFIMFICACICMHVYVLCVSECRYSMFCKVHARV